MTDKNKNIEFRSELEESSRLAADAAADKAIELRLAAEEAIAAVAKVEVEGKSLVELAVQEAGELKKAAEKAKAAAKKAQGDEKAEAKAVAVEASEEAKVSVAEVVELKKEVAESKATTNAAAAAAVEASELAAVEAEQAEKAAVSEQMIKVIFHRTDGSDGKIDVTGRVNDQTFSFQREVKIWAPRKYLKGSIDKAIIKEWIQEDIGEGKLGPLKPYERLRFPYNVLEDPWK